VEQLQLAVEPLLASLDLGWQGISISWGSTFNHITDVDLFPPHPNRGKQLIEDLSCGTYKGASLLIFMPAWCLTNEDYGYVLSTLTGYYSSAMLS
jgi:hypothetical protein